MSNTIEDSLKVEKVFKEKIMEALKKDVSDDIKVEMISIAGLNYFSSKIKLMVKFYEENKEIEEALVQEKIDKEIENYNKRHKIEELSKKELDVINCIIKYKTWATTALISKETKHTWLTVNKYIQKFIDQGFVIAIKTDAKRKKRYTLASQYKFLEKEVQNG